MNLTRRRILMQGTAAAAVVLSGRLSGDPDVAVIADLGCVVNGGAVLFLHDGSGAAAPLVLNLRAEVRAVRDVEVDMLTLQGFAEAGALLDSSRGAALFALLDDGDSIVVESLLKVRGAHRLVHRRHGSQALLSASL